MFLWSGEYHLEYHFELCFVCTHAGLKQETKVYDSPRNILRKSYWAMNVALWPCTLRKVFEKTTPSPHTYVIYAPLQIKKMH